MNDQHPEDAPSLSHALTPGESSAAESTPEASHEMRRFWQVVKRLPTYVKLSTAILRDPDVPKSAKVVLGIGGGYAVSPIDLVPGIIPVAGQMDDVYVLLTALQQALKRMPPEVAERQLASAQVRPEDIDADLAAVRALVRKVVVKTVKFGGRSLGRLSRAAFGFADEQRKRRNIGRTEEPL